jgi:hypothetical protein
LLEDVDISLWRFASDVRNSLRCRHVAFRLWLDWRLHATALHALNELG